MPKKKANELAALPAKSPKDTAAIPFETVVAWIFRSGAKLTLLDGERLQIEVPERAPAWLVDVLEGRRDDLTMLTKRRVLDAHIERRMYQWQDTSDADLKRRGFMYITAQVDKLEELCGSALGYHDPASLFAYECVEDYRRLLAQP